MKFGICYFEIPLGQSETHVLILLDNICDKLTDYVRATRKSDNQLTIFNLMSPSGGMNPMMSEVDIIQDGDLNKSLEHYVSVAYYVLYLPKVPSFSLIWDNDFQCNAIVDEFEEDIVSLYVDGIQNKKEELCTKISHICNDYVDEEDDNDSDNDTYDNYVDESFDIDRDEL